MVDLPELPFIDTMMTSIVFYGLDRKLPVREARELIGNICDLLDETPSHAHVGLDYEGRKSRAPKFGMLDKAIAKGDFDDYSYIEGVNYFEKGNVRDVSLQVGVMDFPPGKRIMIEFRKDRKEPAPVGAMLQEVLRHLSPHYGILYDLTVREGPSWFATGVISSGMSDILSRLSGEFRNKYFFGKKFADGFFRDVFKWNYLSPAHLDKAIEGLRFQDWIGQPSKKTGWFGRPKSRGTLSLLDNGCAIWELTKEEAVEVRPRMLRAGILMVKY